MASYIDRSNGRIIPKVDEILETSNGAAYFSGLLLGERVIVLHTSGL